MLDTIRKSYRANADTLRDWLRLASSPTNPHRLADLVTAGEYMGRVELLAAIIANASPDTEIDKEAEALAAEFDRIKWDTLPPEQPYFGTLFDSDEAEWEYMQEGARQW